MAETLYSLEQIQQCQETLEVMAHKPRTTFTKKQAIEALMDTIEKALEMRSFQEVAEGLAEQGLEISVGTLKQYVSRYRRDHKKGLAKKRTRKTTRGDKTVAEKNAEGNEVKPLAQRGRERSQGEPDAQTTLGWKVEDEFNL